MINRSAIHNPQSAIPRSWQYRDGRFVEVDSIPLTDRGFRYGMHVFETIAVVAGRLLLGKLHFKRLEEAVNLTGLQLPVEFGQRFELIEGLVDRESMGMMRCYVTAGDGGPGGVVAEGRLFVCFEETKITPSEVLLRLTEGNRETPSFMAGVKSGNYWFNNGQLALARNDGFDSVLLYNLAGELVGTPMANVFLRIDGQWVTPLVESGCRAGCVREWVLGRFVCEEVRLSRLDVSRAEAIFLTNSRIGLVAASVVGSRPLVVPESFGGMKARYWEEVGQLSKIA